MNYIRTLLTTAIFTLAIAAGFNWFIDPYGMYWSPLIDGINTHKPEAGNRSRTSKPYVLSHLKPSTLIVGNSRVEMGLNPEHVLLAGKAYNIGIPGLGISGQVQFALNEIQSNTNLEHLIISLDYLDFLHSPKELNMPIDELITHYESRDIQSSAISKVDIGVMLFSLETTQSSFLTVIKQSIEVSTISNRGFNNAASFISIVRNEGKGPLFSQKLNELSARLRNRNLRHHNQDWTKLSPKFLLLENLINHAESKNVTLTFFINPYHMSYLHLLNDLNYWSDFLQWKIHLSTFFKDHIKHKSYKAYDFSGLNHITSEPVELNHPNTQMDWFWEPAHYKSQVGDMMLPILLNENPKPGIGRDMVKGDLEALIKDDVDALKETQQQWINLKERLNLAL